MTLVRPEPDINTPEFGYNEAHRRTRSTIERCIGLLKQRFRCCLKDRILQYSLTMTSKIVNSCVVLHNMCIDYQIPKPYDEDIGDVDIGTTVAADLDENIEQDLHLQRINPQLAEGKQLRRRIIAANFSQAM